MNVVWIVLDGVGIGELPDADAFGDAGSDTLGNLARAVGGLRVPNLERLGLGAIAPLQGIAPVKSPRAFTAKMAERSPGKDSTTGHWELAGIVLDEPFPTYPDGFPTAVIAAFERAIGREVYACGPESGTEIIARLGRDHVATGKPIVYTSADSVFQIAAHEDVIPRVELYRYCELARSVLGDEHAVGRVIARPFVGRDGEFERTAGRRDFSLEPPADTVLDRLTERGVPVFGVGKVGELFAGRGFVEVTKTASNEEGVATILSYMRDRASGLVFANLVDFDTLFGHRNDPAGFARALETFDAALEEIVGRVRGDDMLVLTADHGNDPTTPSTDHSREYVPLLVYWPRGCRPGSLGVRSSFADLGATLADVFHCPRPRDGRSFIRDIR